MRAIFLGLFLVTLVLPLRSRAELVWVDAVGKVITPVAGDPLQHPEKPCGSPPDSRGCYVTFFDDAGLIWLINRETARFLVQGSDRYFTERDCQGPGYVSLLQPRQVFTIRGLPGAWARRDDVKEQVIFPVSIEYASGCVNAFDIQQGVMPVSGLIAVDGTPPNPHARAPLHVERR